MPKRRQVAAAAVVADASSTHAATATPPPPTLKPNMLLTIEWASTDSHSVSVRVLAVEEQCCTVQVRALHSSPRTRLASLPCLSSHSVCARCCLSITSQDDDEEENDDEDAGSRSGEAWMP